MDVTQDTDFCLAQRINEIDGMTNEAEITTRENHLFSKSFLSINDTMVDNLDFTEEFEYRNENDNNSSVINNGSRIHRNVINDNLNNNIEIIDEQINDRNYTNDGNSSTIQEMGKTCKPVEDIFNMGEISIRQTQLFNNTGFNNSAIRESEWIDDSLLDRFIDHFESTDYKEVEMKESKRRPLVEKNHLSPSTSSTTKISNDILEDSPIPQINRKHSLPLMKENQPNKKSRLMSNADEANNFESFYGLPNKVKNLILRVKGITELYEWQEECLNLRAIRDRQNLIYALPTSGGKTLVAEILMLKEIVVNKKNAIFILPFVAIVQEKVRSLAPFALEFDFLIHEYAAGNGQYPPRKRRRKQTIYVCTIEKGLGLINSLMETERLHEIGMLVVDELHLLGEDGGRGATLEGLLTKVMCSKTNPHIIGMSATIGNLNDIAEFLRAEVYTKDFRPVKLKEYVKCEDHIWLVDLKEEEILTDLKKIHYSYSKEAMRLDPDRLGGLVMDVVPHDSCLIFCPTRKNCENVAILLSKILFRTLQDHKKKEKEILLRGLKAEGTLCEILEKTIMFGVAYHHSGLMSEERRMLEEAFRSGTLCVLCCTSTLAAGVNLPARRVILRQPYIGSQFLNLSRYKQMIGRAGRAGMKDVGESILICKTNEIPKVKELLTSKMNDCISTMHIEEDRGMNNLVLSSILLNLATTRSQLHEIVGRTLLGIQQKKLELSTKQITDRTITRLMKAGAISVKQVENPSEVNPNITVLIPTQNNNPDKEQVEPKKTGKKTVQLGSNTELEVCKLGRAAMKGCVDLSRAHLLYRDLKCAQRQLVLLDSLHLLYLVTPYDLVNIVKPSGNIYCDVVCSLSRVQMETARVLGINENVVAKLRSGIMPKNVDPGVVNRFYLTLMLNELWNHQTVYVVSIKYEVNRGIVQNLMNASAAFASCVERFCAELDEFWVFKDLIHSFCNRLSHCCTTELEPLMELPSVKIGRARQLFNAGYKTLQITASADPKEMCERIENMHMRIAIQIIAASKLLLLEKVENLRDEAAEVLDGVDLSSF